MRTEDCELKIDSAALACNLKPETVRDVKRSIGISNQLKETFAEISAFPTDTVLEIGKKDNEPFLNQIIVGLKKILKKGRRPTRNDVKR